jgi:predicted methyltransferase
VTLLRPSDIRALQQAIARGTTHTTASLDLGLTTKQLALRDDSIVIDNELVALPKLKPDEKTCWLLRDGAFVRLRFTGEETGQVYELVETPGRPLLKVSATPFHKWDFIKRIEHDKPQGDVLDAGTGLGYTAIAAARTARRVVTVENDPHIIMLQDINPWSRGLDAKNVTRVEADAFSHAQALADVSFDTIILDGGTPRSSGDFFSLAHYKEMRRVLRSSGTLYHYLPDHGVQRGRDFPAEVIARLRTAGFSDIKRYATENYVVAQADAATKRTAQRTRPIDGTQHKHAHKKTTGTRLPR